MPVGIVIHTMSGTLAGTDGWFAQSLSQVSAHTGVGLGGERHRYVAYQDRAWANGVLEAGNHWQSLFGPTNPNERTLSIETADDGVASTTVSDLQYAAVLDECIGWLAKYGTIRYLVKHSDISPLSRPNCPGGRWVASGLFAALASDLKLRTLS